MCFSRRRSIEREARFSLDIKVQIKWRLRCLRRLLLLVYLLLSSSLICSIGDGRRAARTISHDGSIVELRFVALGVVRSGWWCLEQATLHFVNSRIDRRVLSSVSGRLRLYLSVLIIEFGWVIEQVDLFRLVLLVRLFFLFLLFGVLQLLL